MQAARAARPLGARSAAGRQWGGAAAHGAAGAGPRAPRAGVVHACVVWECGVANGAAPRGWVKSQPVRFGDSP